MSTSVVSPPSARARAATLAYPEPAQPTHERALAHKVHVRSRLRELARQAGAAPPGQLADQLLSSGRRGPGRPPFRRGQPPRRE